MLSVCDSGAGVVALPRLCGLTLRFRSDVRILHNHARTCVPSQNSIVVPGYRKIHGLLIVIHCPPQRVICGRASSSTAVANVRISETLPDDALVVGPPEAALISGKTFLAGFNMQSK